MAQKKWKDICRSKPVRKAWQWHGKRFRWQIMVSLQNRFCTSSVSSWSDKLVEKNTDSLVRNKKVVGSVKRYGTIRLPPPSHSNETDVTDYPFELKSTHTHGMISLNYVLY